MSDLYRVWPPADDKPLELLEAMRYPCGVKGCPGRADGRITHLILGVDQFNQDTEVEVWACPAHQFVGGAL